MQGVRVNAYCIIKKNNSIFLTEDENKPGWKLPGGLIEERELIMNGAKREVAEETGYVVNLTGFVSIQEYLKSSGEHVLRVYFSAELVDGLLKLNPGEVKKGRWLPINEVKKLKQKDFYISQYYLAVREYLTSKSYPINLLKLIE